MPSSTGLERLLHLRGLEEEQRRAALDAAVAELHRLERALDAHVQRERRGREAIASSAQSASPADRIAGIVDCESARRAATLLSRAIAQAAQTAAEVRRLYLDKRTERRQVETLLRNAQAFKALRDARLDQQQLDQAFAIRRHRNTVGPPQPARQTPAEHEMKTPQESTSIPEPEPGSNR